MPSCTCEFAREAGPLVVTRKLQRIWLGAHTEHQLVNRLGRRGQASEDAANRNNGKCPRRLVQLCKPARLNLDLLRHVRRPQEETVRNVRIIIHQGSFPPPRPLSTACSWQRNLSAAA